MKKGNKKKDDKKTSPLFDVLKLLYIETSYEWIFGCYHEVEGMMLLRFLSMEPSVLPYIGKAEKILIHLNPLQQLIYLHTLIPKRPRAPFTKYLKPPKAEKDPLVAMYETFRKYFNYSENEFEIVKPYIRAHVEKDLGYWTKHTGMPVRLQNKYGDKNGS